MNLRFLLVVLFVATGLILGIGLSNPLVLHFIEDSGANIPTDNVIGDYIKGLVWAVTLLALVFALPIAWDHKRLLAGGWLIKTFTTMVLMLPYEEHYWGLDCWTYFRRAHADTEELYTSLFRGGGDLVVALTGLFVRIGPDSYHAVKLSFAFLGLLALYLFHRSAEDLLGRRMPLAFWVLLLYPSVLFWSSILGKDPVVLLGIGVHVWGIAKTAAHRRSRYLWAVFAGILLVSSVRVWMGLILLLPSVLVVITRIQGVFWRSLTFAAVILGTVGLAYATAQRFSLQNSADLVEATRTVTDGFGSANSSLDTEIELNSTWDLLAFAPEGLFNTFFRPLPGDVDNTFGLLAGVENLMLLLLATWAALQFRLRHLRNPLFFWSIALLLTWGSAYSLITYHDLGTAVRFKLQILPVLLGVIGYLIRKKTRPVMEPARVPWREAERAA